MPVIRVDSEVFEFLQSHAKPFVDDPNAVLRRLLNLPTKSSGARRGPRGPITAQPEFRLPLLRALTDLGGAARAAEVIDRVGSFVSLTTADRDNLPTGEIRWRNTVAWERAVLVKEGMMLESKKRGVWEISDSGRAFVAKNGDTSKLR